jgi:hypothetical protein
MQLPKYVSPMDFVLIKKAGCRPPEKIANDSFAPLFIFDFDTSELYQKS